MINNWLLENLRCPADKARLAVRANQLVCQTGHCFPIIDDIPVLLLRDVEPTLHVARTSVDMAFDNDVSHSDPLYLASLGVNREQRDAIAKDIQAGKNDVDPVVNYLVAHTNGILYKHLVGQLTSYPIPEIPLPAGQGRRLLDVGCSWGRWCIAAAREGYRPIGIDPSLGAVLAAGRVANTLGIAIDFVVADARHLPFAEQCFDTVYSYSVLQHFNDEDVGAACREIARVVKESGCAKIQLANCYGIRSIYHQLRRRFRAARGFEVRYRSPAKMKRFFDNHAFDTSLETDCFFGLGIQAADAPFMPFWKRFVLRASEFLKKIAARLYPLRIVADSIFVIACRR